MEIEEEFLQNASIMVKYASQEIKQFLVWNNKQVPYDLEATSILRKLEEVKSAVNQLQQDYCNRS